MKNYILLLFGLAIIGCTPNSSLTPPSINQISTIPEYERIESEYIKIEEGIAIGKTDKKARK